MSASRCSRERRAHAAATSCEVSSRASGRGCSSSHVTCIGRFPTWETYRTGPKQVNAEPAPFARVSDSRTNRMIFVPIATWLM